MEATSNESSDGGEGGSGSGCGGDDAETRPRRRQPHPLENRVGALLVPPAELQRVIASVAPGSLRDKPCTVFHRDRRGRGASEPAKDAADEKEDQPMMALHVSHAVALAAERGGEAGLAAALGQTCARALAAGTVRWVPGLRQFSAACRKAAQDRVLDAWARRAEHEGPAANEGAPGSVSGRTSRSFRFVELFAGIGGFRLGLESLGGRCVLAAEIDEGARGVYEANFGEECVGDVVALEACDVPSHDILTAGFPCQPFAFCNTNNAALTGSLHSGRGILDERRGALGLEIARLLHTSRPAACILENVPNLCSFNNGSDLKILEDALFDAGYSTRNNVLDARDFGLAQQRKRLYIVGLRLDLPAAAVAAFKWPESGGAGATARLRDVLEPDEDVPPQCFLSAQAWATMRAQNPKAVLPSGRGGRMARLDGYARTLTASYRRNGGTYSELVPVASARSDAASNCCGSTSEWTSPARSAFANSDADREFYQRDIGQHADGGEQSNKSDDDDAAEHAEETAFAEKIEAAAGKTVEVCAKNDNDGLPEIEVAIATSAVDAVSTAASTSPAFCGVASSNGGGEFCESDGGQGVGNVEQSNGSDDDIAAKQVQEKKDAEKTGIHARRGTVGDLTEQDDDFDPEIEAALDAAYQAEAAAGGAAASWVPRAPRPRPAWRTGQAPPRFFTRRECCRLQGFPEDFRFANDKRRCKDAGRFYHFIGNAVVPPVIRAIGESVLVVLEVAGTLHGCNSVAVSTEGSCVSGPEAALPVPTFAVAAASSADCEKEVSKGAVAAEGVSAIPVDKTPFDTVCYSEQGIVV